MQAAAKKVTQFDCEIAMRARWGSIAKLRVNKFALSAEKKAQRLARIREINERLEEITQQQSANGDDKSASLRALVKAAQFVRDVGGDDPSIPQLVSELAKAESVLSRSDERAALNSERKELSAGLHVSRYEIYKFVSFAGIAASHQLANANTLPELMEEIQNGRD